MTVAVTRAFDAVLVVHAVVAVCAIVVLVVLRTAAGAAQRGAPLGDGAARSFTGRRELAGRVVHLVPLTGVAVLVVSDGNYRVGDWFVLAGLALWALAAVCLEVVAMPAQRDVAAALHAGESSTMPARRMAHALDVAMSAIVVAAVVMIAAQR